MLYIAYSPLAGGFLSGNFTNGNSLAGTRFEEGNPAGNFFKAMYDKPVMHSALEDLQVQLESLGIGAAEASLRWLCYSSALGEGDGLILGASKIEQLKQNHKAISDGPLPEHAVQAFEKMWKAVKFEAP